MLADTTAVLAAGSIEFNVTNLVDTFWQSTVDGLSYGAVYALVADREYR